MYSYGGLALGVCVRDLEPHTSGSCSDATGCHPEMIAVLGAPQLRCVWAARAVNYRMQSALEIQASLSAQDSLLQGRKEQP